jgi:amino acid transporter
MASSSIDIPGSVGAGYITNGKDKEYNSSHDKLEEAQVQSDSIPLKLNYDSTHRQLRPRHIQLIGIGGTIGTALYVQIGHGLINGGPASLFIAFTIWYV